MTPSESIKCKVVVERLLYPRVGFSAGDFAIIACKVVDTIEGEPYNEHVVIKGRVYSADVGVTYDLCAALVLDPKYGHTYQVKSFQHDSKMTGFAERDAFVKTILTEKQYKAFRAVTDDPLGLIEQGKPEALTTVKGISLRNANAILSRYTDRIQFAKAYTRLSEYGITPDRISSLLEAFHNDADALITTLDANPYSLISIVSGIGWSRADAIAERMGITGLDPRRRDAYVLSYLEACSEKGNTWWSPDLLWDDFSNFFDTNDSQMLLDSMNRLHDSGKLWWDDEHTKLALPRLRNIEKRIAEELHRIANGEKIKVNDSASEIAQIEKRQGWSFTDEQMSAVHSILDNNVVIITGFGGTGKTSAVSAALELLSGHSFAQCALSGRAAARLAEVTGQEGKTIHRLLEYQGQFTRNKDNPLDEEIIILDEVSMVGAELFLDLIKAIPTGSKLVMLGDDGQLESIGLCNIFKDMLDSGMIPVTRLTKIHRQAAKSAIITESIKVRNGQQLCAPGWTGTETRGELNDLTLHVFGSHRIAGERVILTKEYVLDHYKELVESGISPNDIQIVLPMKTRGDCCTSIINNEVQDYINAVNVSTEVKPTPSSPYGLRLGDRVICVKNMYKATRPFPSGYDDFDEPVYEVCPVYNGDRGVITSISNESMVICFDLWGDILIKRSDYTNIELGYALSCHKLQGSEANYIIVGFDMASRVLLTKEWLYTAITRAKKHCIIAAQDRALSFCISTSNISTKQTFLKEMLIDEFSSGHNTSEVM